MIADLEARVKIDSDLIAAISGMVVKRGFLENIAKNLKKEGINVTKKKVGRIIYGELKSVPTDFYVKVVGKEPKEAIITEKAKVDSDLIAALHERERSTKPSTIAKNLRTEGIPAYKVSIEKILNGDYKFVSPDFYAKVVGKEPKDVKQTEKAKVDSDLIAAMRASKESPSAFAKSLREKGINADKRTIERALSGQYKSVPVDFYKKVVGKEPEVIKLRKAKVDSDLMSSLKERNKNDSFIAKNLREDGIYALKADIDKIICGQSNFVPIDFYRKVVGKEPKKVMQESRAKVDSDLIAALKQRKSLNFTEFAQYLKNKGYNVTRRTISRILREGKPNNNLHTVPHKLYVELVGIGQLANNPQCAKICSMAELELLYEGKRNYGNAFTEKILPVIISIKDKHFFPAECLERLVNFPKTIPDQYGTRQDLAASEVGKAWLWYKGVLDWNKKNGFDFGVTMDGTSARLSEANEKINQYSKS